MSLRPSTARGSVRCASRKGYIPMDWHPAAKGKITFWGEIDRQHVLHDGTVEDVKTAVRRVRAALDDGKGGVIAQCEWGKGDPAENAAAVFEAWNEPL